MFFGEIEEFMAMVSVKKSAKKEKDRPLVIKKAGKPIKSKSIIPKAKPTRLKPLCPNSQKPLHRFEKYRQ